MIFYAEPSWGDLLTSQYQFDSFERNIYDETEDCASAALSIHTKITSVGPFFLRFYIYHPLRSGRIWHKVSLFKWSLTGSNSEYFFS